MSYMKIDCPMCNNFHRVDLLYFLGDEKYPRYVCVSECENCGAGVVSGNFGTPKEAVLDARQRFAGIITGTVKTKDEIATVKADLHKKYWRLCHAESVATDDININFGPKKSKKSEAQ